MKRLSAASLLFLVLACTAAYGQNWGQDWTLFDNFNQRFLDPAKWLQVPACRYWTQELECVRELRFGQLRLAVWSYGDLNSDTGSRYGNSELYFNNPSSISGFRSTVVIRQTSTKACPASATFSNAQAVLGGNYFNNGTYDVWAFLVMARDSSMSDPGLIWANLLVQRLPDGAMDMVDMGGLRIGEPVIAQLDWDKANHRFLARVVRIKTGEVLQQSLSYADSDTLPSSDPQRLLSARAFPANCVGATTRAGMEATFDDVMVKK